jgi:Protein of unknown function (DUF3108)
MMFHLRVVRTTILATGSALALMTAALGNHAHAEGKLDASYTISFARIRVGDIAATGVFGESEYTISARGRAGGIMRVLVDGEASFSTHGTIKDGYPVPTTFTRGIELRSFLGMRCCLVHDAGPRAFAIGRHQQHANATPITFS